MSARESGFSTRAIHAGQEPDPTTGARAGARRVAINGSAPHTHAVTSSHSVDGPLAEPGSAAATVVTNAFDSASARCDRFANVPIGTGERQHDPPHRRRGVGRFWPFLGPAFIAAVAYVDPGNFATNMAGGAKFGYLLLWVVLVANLMAMLIQSMSAKLGIATGMNLPEVCRDRFPFRVVVLDRKSVV